MDLLARKEALSHQIEMTEEGLAFIGLHELYFCFVGRTGAFRPIKLIENLSERS